MKKALLKLTSVVMAAVMFLGMAAFDTSTVLASTKTGKPGQVKKVTAKLKKPSWEYQLLRVTVKWAKSGKCCKYEVYRKTGNGKWKKVKTVTIGKKAKSGKCLVKVKINKKYQFKVRAINKKGKGKFSAVREVVIPNGVRIDKTTVLVGDNHPVDRGDEDVVDETEEDGDVIAPHLATYDVDKVVGNTAMEIPGAGSVKLGDTLEAARNEFGKECRVFKTDCDYDWYVFNAVSKKNAYNAEVVDAADWGHMVWLGILNGKVVAAYTVADDWKVVEDGKVIRRCGSADDGYFEVVNKYSSMHMFNDPYMEGGDCGRDYGVLLEKKMYEKKAKVWDTYEDYILNTGVHRDMTQDYVSDATYYIVNGIRHQYNSIACEGITKRKMLVENKYLNESAQIKSEYLANADLSSGNVHNLGGYTSPYCFSLVMKKYNFTIEQVGVYGVGENIDVRNWAYDPIYTVQGYIDERGSGSDYPGHRREILSKSYRNYGSYQCLTGKNYCEVMHFKGDFKVIPLD